MSKIELSYWGVRALEQARAALGHKVVKVPDRSYLIDFRSGVNLMVGDQWVESLMLDANQYQADNLPLIQWTQNGAEASFTTDQARIKATREGWEAELSNEQSRAGGRFGVKIKMSSLDGIASVSLEGLNDVMLRGGVKFTPWLSSVCNSARITALESTNPMVWKLYDKEISRRDWWSAVSAEVRRAVDAAYPKGFLSNGSPVVRAANLKWAQHMRGWGPEADGFMASVEASSLW